MTTIAGITPSGGAPVRGYSGDGGPAQTATLALANLQNDCDPNRFEQTSHLSLDSQGNLYLADSQNHRIRRIAPGGTISTAAGTGQTPPVNARCEPAGPVGDGGASGARLFNPSEALLHPNGNLIIADQVNNRIRQLTPNGVVSTIAGNGSHNLYAPGIPATSSPMDWPSSLAVDPAGLIYFAELHGNRVGRIEADGRLATVAGTGFPGFNGDQSSATRATLTKPAGIAIDAAGNLLIADTGNHRIRKVSGTAITTIAGTGQASYCGDGGSALQACLNTPMDVKADAAGNIYIADAGNHRIRRIDASGMISTVAGTGQPGRGPDGVAATESALNFPSAIAVDGASGFYIVDWQNYLIRRVAFRTPPAVGEGGVIDAAGFRAPVSPGSLITIFGSGFEASTEQAPSSPWPRALGGVVVRVNGNPIPLFVVSPAQVNAQLPYETQPGQATLTVSTSAGESAPHTFSVAGAAPGIFQYPGTERAIALNQDGSLNSPDAPESRGRILVVFATGIGAVDPPVETGKAAPSDVISSATAARSASVGGADAPVLFLGLTPGFIGLGQLNVLLPEGAATGAAIPLTLIVDGARSNTALVSVR